MTEGSGLVPARRHDASQGPRIIGPRDGRTVDLGAVGVRFMVWGEEYQARYGTQVDLDRTRHLCEQHGLRFPIDE